MTQLKSVVDPFGEVNVYPAGAGRSRIVATILMKPHREGAQTGLAIDGSGSMRKLFGDAPRPVSSIFGAAKQFNEITPVAQKLCAYLARNIDADQGTTCIYWSVGPNGSGVEVIGDLSADQAERHTFGPPQDYGTGTQLLPAVRYFVERFRSAPWGFYVFVTDGELHDLDDVLAYSKRLAQDIAARRRNPVKLVLIGMGPDINERQMEELDDLDTGTDIDLWDHKLAKEMRVLEEIFAEVVDKNARVATTGRILGPDGRVIRDYAGVGVPACLEFEVPAGAEYFTLELNGSRVNQSLRDGASVPTSGTVTLSTPAPVVPPALPQQAPPPPVPAAPAPAKPEVIEDLPVDNPADAEWKNLPLEFGPDRDTAGQ